MKRMKLNFKKIASILAGTVMLSSTLAFAAAANTYPAPFVKSGSADVAVVYGSQPGAEFDLLAVADITTSLQAKLAAQTASSGSSGSSDSVSGEAVSLSSGSTKIWLNTSLNTALATLGKTDLPKVLGEYTFSGNVDSKITSTITIGSSDKVTFAKQPSSNDDPVIGISLGTTSGAPLYNASITMPAINFTSADSKGETIKLFGRDFVVSTATDSTSLVLFSSAKEVALSAGASDSVASETVNIAGTDYVVTLVTGTSTTATVSVNGESKEITEGASKKVGGIDVAVKSVTESTALNTVTASLLVGSQKITFQSGTQVLVGSDDDPVDGTYVTFTGTTGALTGLNIGVYAPNTNEDAILSGEAFTDPVFGSFKIDFSGLNVPMNSSSRDTIKVDKSGDKGMSLTMTDSDGVTDTFDFVYNGTTTFLGDSNGYRTAVLEGTLLNENNYTIVGNEDYGHLIQVTRIYNNTGSDYSKDAVTFKDIISGDTYNMDATSEGAGRLTVDGRQYTVAYLGSGDTGNVTIKYPTSDSSATQYVLFPSIETNSGALIQLTQPTAITLSSQTGFMIPDGDGYTTVTAALGAGGGPLGSNWTIGGTTINLTGTTTSTLVGVGTLWYNFTMSGANQTTVRLATPVTNTSITAPAVVMLNGKDDNSNYHAIVTTLEASSAGTSTDPLGVDDVYFTSQNKGLWNSVSLQSDSDISQSVDWYGSLVTEDSNTASQKVVTISNPNTQAYANVYVGELAASITAGEASVGTVKELGSVSLTDTQAAQVSGKNLIVVGGSCVNRLASELLSGSGCGSSWETKTGVGAGQFLIQSFERTGGKVATLVAGYNAEDTRNAAKVLISDATVDLTAGKKYKSTSATSVQMVTTAA